MQDVPSLPGQIADIIVPQDDVSAATWQWAHRSLPDEVEGAEIARRFLERHGLSAGEADRVAIAILLHMQPSVTLEDGVESVLLDRATGLDVRGDGYALVDVVRPRVMHDFPRRAFDRRFLDAVARDAAIRPTCQSARLLHRTGLAAWMARSPWATDPRDDPGQPAVILSV